MTATCLVHRDDVQVWHADHLALLAAMPYRDDGSKCDLLCVDAPYSERTHKGHDGAAAAEDGATWVRSNGRVEKKIARRDLNYSAWTPEDVVAFVAAWAPVTRGWIVSLTDDVLFPHWRAAMESVGLQTFQDVPALISGMTVRLNGDGPSSWAIHCAVGRPRTRQMAKWGTLRGGYSGPCERQETVGGKPIWLMEAIVRDYSRPSDVVCDPCCGKGGTTLLAALRTGRRAIGGDAMREHAEMSAARVNRPVQRPLFVEGAR